MKRSPSPYPLLIFFILLSSLFTLINTTDQIIIRNGETIVSAGYELGFFSPNNSTNLYVGIWYKNVSVTTPIWIANKETPLNTSSGILKLTQSGQLSLQDGYNNTIWSSSSNNSRIVRKPVLQLLDSGNLVIYDDLPENYIWQSFDYPTNTYTHGLELGWNLNTGTERYLSSWKNADDPSPGPFTLHLDIHGYPQVFIKRDNTLLCRIGPWNGMRFSGSPTMRRDPTFRAQLFMNTSVVYYREDNDGSIWRLTLNEGGIGQRWRWMNQSNEWSLYYNLPGDICDNYRLCGAQGSCNIGNSPPCGCLDRFVPRDGEGWIRSDWSGGCVRRVPLSLSCEGDVFLKYSGIKMPDSRQTWFNESLSLGECRSVCLRNCSCMAYSNLDIRNGGRGCLIWFGDLVDIRLIPGEQQVIYIRMAASELDSKGKKGRVIIISISLLGMLVLLALSFILFIWKKKKNKQKQKQLILSAQRHEEDLELPTIDLSTVRKATNDFSISNKLGEGGFGPVYKGTLGDGKEIAVKRLSATSKQGLGEFKNEVICIAKLQHRNLVKLLGCCIQEEEKILIYEYMPNKSLDFILFDQIKTKQLDWPKRFHIINGIARGLLYLHQDSRLRIIHRDLKASNILLDANMNPKISDFGMARSFGGNETQANTIRVVGTYGYMSPEYTVDGLFSIKSDVYSFGVLVLELVSSRKNRGFHHEDHNHNLLGHAWILHNEGRSLELADDNLVNSSYMWELLRSIHVALLCVQQSPEDRPSMASVVLMLGSEGSLPRPKQPGFFTERDVTTSNTTSSKITTYSSNEFTITTLDAR